MLCLTHRAIYDYLTAVDSKIKQSTIGPQLVGVAVANGLLPYRAGSGVSKEKYVSHTVYVI